MIRRARGFTLVEVLVALMIVAMGLAALMVAVSGTARTTGYLRDKTLAQWIALNRLSEVRLNVNKSGQSAPAAQSSLSSQSADATEIKFANRTWHYDTRYFDTSITTMKRIVVRVYAGDAKTKGNALVEATSFYGTALGAPGGSNIDWTTGMTLASLPVTPGQNGVVNGNPATPGTPGNPGATNLGRPPLPIVTPSPAPPPPPESE